MSSRFRNIEMAAPVEVYALYDEYKKDERKQRVNLTAGVYRNDEGEPWILPVVRKVESNMVNDDFYNHEYLPVLGLESFTELATSFLLGKNSPAILEKRAFGVQCLSGGGSLRVGAEFLSRIFHFNTFYYSNPTWESHARIFPDSGFTDKRQYRYWDSVKRKFDFDGMLEDLRNAPENSVIILHACAHNHTGCDPTVHQWQIIADTIEEKKLFAFFDCAYQGFVTGDSEEDAYAVRLFVQRGIEFLCAQSFAKNFGLYNERIGNLTVVMNSPEGMLQAKSQMTLVVRGMYSNPPNHGAQIVSRILGNPKLYEEWKDHIQVMSNRMTRVRKQFYEHILKLKIPGNWDHLMNQKGMFFYSGLSERQVDHMKHQYGVYLLSSGRFSLCGLNDKNINYVAKALYETIIKFPHDHDIISK